MQIKLSLFRLSIIAKSSYGSFNDNHTTLLFTNKMKVVFAMVFFSFQNIKLILKALHI